MEYKKFSNLLILIIFSIISFCIASEPLTPLEVQEFDRMSSPILSPDGKYVINQTQTLLLVLLFQIFYFFKEKEKYYILNFLLTK